MSRLLLQFPRSQWFQTVLTFHAPLEPAWKITRPCALRQTAPFVRSTYILRRIQRFARSKDSKSRRAGNGTLGVPCSLPPLSWLSGFYLWRNDRRSVIMPSWLAQENHLPLACLLARSLPPPPSSPLPLPTTTALLENRASPLFICSRGPRNYAIISFFIRRGVLCPPSLYLLFRPKIILRVCVNTLPMKWRENYLKWRASRTMNL